MTTASGTDEHNQELAVKRAVAVKAELGAAGFNSVNTRVTETPLGELAAAGSEEANFRRVDMIPDGGQPQTVAAHEFGHAFGLDDEYGAEFGAGRPAAGTPVAHDTATKAMTDATGAHLPRRRGREQQQHDVRRRSGPAAALLDVPRGPARDHGDRGMGARRQAGAAGRAARRPRPGARSRAGRAVTSPGGPGCSRRSRSRAAAATRRSEP